MTFLQAYFFLIVKGHVCLPEREEGEGEHITQWGMVTLQFLFLHFSILLEVGACMYICTCTLCFSSLWDQNLNLSQPCGIWLPSPLGLLSF